MKSRRVLALDIGSRVFKAVLLEMQDAKAMLTQVRLMELPTAAGPDVRQAALKSLLEGIEPDRLTHVVSVVDDPFSCIHQVFVPPMPAAELADAVKWEMQRFLAIPPEEVAVDYKRLDQREVDGILKQRLLAVALPAAAIREHLGFLAQAGVKPTHLIPKASALSVWVRRTRPSSAHQAVGVLETGASGCEFLLAEKGEAVFSRKIPGGGSSLTKEMTGVLMTGQGQVSMTEAEAETVKRSIGIPQGDAAGLGVRGVSAAQIFSLIRSSLERLAMETERSVAFYGESGGPGAINDLVLAGGGAHLKGLREWLQERLGLRVTVPEVFEGMTLAPGAVQGSAGSMGLSLAAAVGAALGAGQGMNLLPADLQENFRARLQKAALKAAVAGALLSAGLLWAGLQMHRHNLRVQIAALELERQAVARKIPPVRAAVSLQQRWNSEPDWEEFFRRLTHQVPPEVYLTELIAENGEVTLRGRIRKTGRSADEALTQFMQKLGEAGVSQVSLRSSRQLEQSMDLAEFELAGHLK